MMEAGSLFLLFLRGAGGGGSEKRVDFGDRDGELDEDIEGLDFDGERERDDSASA